MKTVHGIGKNVNSVGISDADQSRERPKPVSTTRSKTSKERTPGKDSSHRLSRVVTPVTAFVEEEGQPTKQRTVLCTSEAVVHNLKVKLFNRCLKLFSVCCLSVTTS